VYKIFVAGLLVIISNGANAEWTQVGGSSDGDITTYVDLSTIKKSGNTVKIWRMLDSKTIERIDSSDPGHLSTQSRIEYDCQEETSTILSLIEFSGNMGKGSIIYSFTNKNPNDKQQIRPQSLNRTILEIACGK
jgi:hypothetical protein